MSKETYKAILEARQAIALKHLIGRHNQMTHANRYGSFSRAKESLRRLKGDKEAREKYKAKARKEPKKQYMGEPTKSTLKTGNVTKVYGDLEGASETYVGKLDDGTKVLVKKRKVGQFDTTKAEELSYETAKAMGMDDLVVKTTLRPNGDSIQIFDTNSIPLTSLEKGSKISETDLKRMAVLDMVTGNFDRHDGNVLVNKAGRVKAIDNDYGFVANYGLSRGYDVQQKFDNSSKIYERFTGKKLALNKSDLAPAISLKNNQIYMRQLKRRLSKRAYENTLNRLDRIERLSDSLSTTPG